MQRISILLILTIISLFGYSQEKLFNCFTIVAGKNATADGSVMLAHNEDDYGKQVVNIYKVPQKQDTEEIQLQQGGIITTNLPTASYLWLEMPGMSFSDCFMNEYGVTIVSNQCTSREDTPEITDGGIMYQLRKQIAEQSTSARHAVSIATKLLQQWGYNSSGRTYTIADTKEAYILAVVNGKHWAAVRVPDDKVAVIPNYYTLTNIDLSDTINFIVSPDIIEYATSRGWYTPATDGEFNFRLAYADTNSLKHPVNIGRMWRGVNLLANKAYDYNDAFPTFFSPEKAITPNMLMNILRDHFEGTTYYYAETEGLENPHQNEGTICAAHNQYGLVAQLRSDMPVEIGAMMWLAMRRPCCEAFVPWYSGISEVPQGYTRYDYKWAEQNHYAPEEGTWDRIPVHAYFTFADYADFVDDNYSFRKISALQNAQKLENKFLGQQEKSEKRLLKLYNKNSEKFLQEINWKTTKSANKAWNSISTK